MTGLKHLMAGLLMVLIGVSCAEVKPAEETPAEFDYSGPVSNLWVTDPASAADSREVLIVLQGGPREFLYFVKDGRTLARYLPGYHNKHVVYLHQAQTLDPGLFEMGKDMSIERARQEKAATTAMLDKAVRYFKDAGNSVTVLGHSYGAFIAVDYLANYEPQADRYILTAGRIAVPGEMVQDNLRGLSSQFEPDGKTYKPVTDVDLSDRNPYEQKAYYVRAMLKAAYGEPRYGKKLSAHNLENVVFVTGKSDQQVGVLTTQEADLLEGRGVQIIYVDGGHSDVFKRMIDKVMSGDIDF